MSDKSYRAGRCGRALYMCGISGFVGAPDGERLARMMASLRHRGPDDARAFVSANASLSATRLAIVDPLHGGQPMSNEDGTVVVVFNGEVYDADALRERLRARGHRFSTRCDTEVLPHLYEEYGDAFVDHVNGQFAVALWDVVRRRLVLTRDRMGIKPLFFARAGGRFYFASEIKAILAALPQKPEIRAEALGHYLSLKYVPGPMTIYEGIERLLPAEQVIVQDERVTRRRYWRWMNADGSVVDRPRGDSRQAAERLEQLLQASVGRRLQADVPVGALLSGGVDSSLIVSLAAEASAAPLSTFTLGYTEDLPAKQQELALARTLARKLGTDHHEYFVGAEEVLADLPRVLAAFDEPFAGVTSTYFLCKLVGRHVKVCLSGDGADELFGSYLAHRLAQPIHNLLHFGEPAVRMFPGLAAPFEQDIDRVLRTAHPDDSFWRAALCVFSDEEKRELLQPDLRLPDGAGTTDLIRGLFGECRSRDPLNRQLDFDCRSLLPDNVLGYSDRLAMAHGVETRVPFLDHEIVEFAFALPGEWKIRAGCCKWILKQVARRRLPAEIVDRPKEGFVMPVNTWQAGPFRAAVEDALSPDALAVHGLFRPSAVADLLRRYAAGESELQYKVWSLFCFQRWYEGTRRGSPPATDGTCLEATPAQQAAVLSV
ncbi:MAG: asparagine synthase (glutamine-hydrolyzing) [Planctomycetes bacterium]|nr:asparagine synthase (glutamine-hydrolyzing) [Planctomycetota bacterium]